ncbi:MAG: adenylate kinase family protein [Pyrinomonadaceae bacterium]
MSKIIVLIGAPGAGKGTQARKIEAELGVPQVSTGDMFREIQNEDTPLAKEVKEILASGTLVTDEVTFEMVKERTLREDCAGTYILDGFPRTPVQAEMLEALAEEQGKSIVAILIDVPFDNLEKRLVGRRSCPVCGEIYNVNFKPPKNEGFCNFHPEVALKHRADDTEDKVKIRLATYEENTKPLIQYYDASGRLERIDGTKQPEVIFSELKKLIGVENAVA